jgi:hypothetical protein
MPGGTAGGDDGLQDAAGALGQGLIQTGIKDSAAGDAQRCAPLHTKIEAWYHLTANISYPLMIVLSVLLLPAMIIRFYQGWFQMLYIDLPLFMASTFSISSFYLVSQRELFPRSWPRALLYLPFLMALGIGLDYHQHQSRDGSADRQAERLRAHAQISRRVQTRQSWLQIPQAPGMGSVDRTGWWAVILR